MSQPCPENCGELRVRSGQEKSPRAGKSRGLAPPDHTRLLVFDDQADADSCAQGIADAGIHTVHHGALDGGDDAFAEVLDRHNETTPETFEPDPGDPNAPYKIGLAIGAAMLRDYNLTSP